MEVPKQTLTPTTTKLQTKPKETIKMFRETEDLDLSSHPVRHVVEITIPQRNATLEQMQQTDRLHEKKRLEGQKKGQQNNAQSNSDGNVQAAAHALN